MDESQNIPPTTPPDKDYFHSSEPPPNREIYNSPARVLLKFIGMAIVFLIIVTAAASWIFQGVIFKAPVLQPTPTPEISKTVPPTDPTADWKTYRNDKYGFEFKYPGSLDFVELEQGKSIMVFPIGKKSEQIANREIFIFVDKNPTRLSAHDFWKEKASLNGYPDNPISVVKIGTLDAVQVPNNGLDHKKLSFIIISEGDKAIGISLNEYPPPISSYDKSIDKLEYDQILSTFKFTDGISKKCTPKPTICDNPKIGAYPRECTIEPTEGWCPK